MNFKRTLESYLGERRKKDKRGQGTPKTFFSAFIVAAMGFSGSILEDASKILIAETTAIAAAETRELSVAPTVAIQDTCSKEQAELLGTFPKEGALVSAAEQANACKTVEILTDGPVEQMEQKMLLAENQREEQEQREAKLIRVQTLEEMTKGHPIAAMSDQIADLSPEIGALVVGIAKKESNWGKRSPSKQGKDCYNYWGFKGKGERGTGMGHACFATKEEAVEKIAKRLEKLVDKRGTSKPSALVTTWKCGNTCAGHSKESVNKWVSDVNGYYTKVLAMK